MTFPERLTEIATLPPAPVSSSVNIDVLLTPSRHYEDHG